jgi:hypothetical protein
MLIDHTRKGWRPDFPIDAKSNAGGGVVVVEFVGGDGWLAYGRRRDHWVFNPIVSPATVLFHTIL